MTASQLRAMLPLHLQATGPEPTVSGASINDLPRELLHKIFNEFLPPETNGRTLGMDWDTIKQLGLNAEEVKAAACPKTLVDLLYSSRKMHEEVKAWYYHFHTFRMEITEKQVNTFVGMPPWKPRPYNTIPAPPQFQTYVEHARKMHITLNSSLFWSLSQSSTSKPITKCDASDAFRHVLALLDNCAKSLNELIVEVQYEVQYIHTSSSARFANDMIRDQAVGADLTNHMVRQLMPLELLEKGVKLEVFLTRRCTDTRRCTEVAVGDKALIDYIDGLEERLTLRWCRDNIEKIRRARARFFRGRGRGYCGYC